MQEKKSINYVYIHFTLLLDSKSKLIELFLHYQYTKTENNLFVPEIIFNMGGER